MNARPCGALAVAHEAAEGTERLEHGVHMADQQQVAALAAAAFGDQVRRAADCVHRDPARRETKRTELALQPFTDLPNAGDVERARIEVHEFFEQRHRLRRGGVDAA